MAQVPPGNYDDLIELTCAQVPKDFTEGSPVWVWLGSDNNKGQPTTWNQGICGVGVCYGKENVSDKLYEISIGDVYILPRTVEKAELLQASPETYATSLSEAAIVGLNNYSSQVVQLLSRDEFATIGAVIATLIPDIQQDLYDRVEGAAEVEIVPRLPIEKDIEKPGATSTVISPAKPLIPEIDDDDEVLQDVRHHIADGAGGVLLVGPPGTGKSYYARQVAIRLTGGDGTRIREVQFHPSYQYEDFVEGLVPDAEIGFRLVDKHLLEMVIVAKRTEGPVVLVIDEFSRTDPARVLGEAMTYMEGTLRGVDFHLRSGRKARIPANLIFLATMNPEDRSVDEIDDAMDRRWTKITLSPDPARVRFFLDRNGASPEVITPIMDFFMELQKHMAIGHAFFKNVHDADSMRRLWNSQLHYAARKKFRFSPDELREVEALWTECDESMVGPDAPAGQMPG
ncbi:McrB family protein [Methylobacterium sp. J-092]|uniref:McrB family protein n=1 Tax=Methylobacterium sp. J-092 TaxID=2836667 RepID=UPI001FB9FFA6|nr:AAA family ATPase [Methylobacterium sp. J-092]